VCVCALCMKRLGQRADRIPVRNWLFKRLFNNL